MEDLWQLRKVDMDQLCLQIQTEERKKVAFLYLNQLIVSLYTQHTAYS